jgi:hypothetical protein
LLSLFFFSTSFLQLPWPFLLGCEELWPLAWIMPRLANTLKFFSSVMTLASSAGVWSLCLMLARHALYHLSHSVSPFMLYFSDRLLCFCPGLPTYASQSSWAYRCEPLCPALPFSVLPSLNIPHSVYPLTSWWTFELFPLSRYYE